MLFHALLGLSLANPLPQDSSELDFDLGNKPSIDKIINGEAATVDDFPMTGGMLLTGSVFGNPLNSFICSSTLIAPDVVLLAAHCLDDMALSWGFGVEDMKVYWTRQADLTEWDGSNPSPEFPADTIEAIDWVVHEDFNIQTLQMGLSNNSDIALIFLSEPVLDVEPAYLATTDEGEQMQEGDLLFVVGWGQQVATEQQQAPPAGTYAIKQQGESFIAELSPYEMKVGDQPGDVRKCHGDSGGPSFWEAADGIRLVGVTSHAYDNSDCFQTGGVDTRTTHYRVWIDEQMSSRCEAGTRVWCEEDGILPYGYFQEEEEPVEEEGKGLFACSVTPFEMFFGLPLLGLLGISRRRR